MGQTQAHPLLPLTPSLEKSPGGALAIPRDERDSGADPLHSPRLARVGDGVNA